MLTGFSFEEFVAAKLDRYDFQSRPLLLASDFGAIMTYRVDAKTAGGSIVGVIVETPQTALAKVKELEEDGFDEVIVKNLAGERIELYQLVSLASGDISSS